MRVDHLYVLPILASLDTGDDMKLETSRTAKALYARHGGKAKTAALVQISNVSFNKFESDVLETSGDNVPLGGGIEKKSPEKDKPTSTLDDKVVEIWLLPRSPALALSKLISEGVAEKLE